MSGRFASRTGIAIDVPCTPFGKRRQQDVGPACGDSENVFVRSLQCSVAQCIFSTVESGDLLPDRSGCRRFSEEGVGFQDMVFPASKGACVRSHLLFAIASCGLAGL